MTVYHIHDKLLTLLTFLLSQFQKKRKIIFVWEIIILSQYNQKQNIRKLQTIFKHLPNVFILLSSAQDPDPQKYADQRIRIQGTRYQQKKSNKFTLNYRKKRDYKNFLISEWFIKFQHKIKQKKTKLFENFASLIFFSKFYGNNQDPDPFFSQRGSRIRIKIKWILSTALKE